jgi:hypothetical protein
MRGTFLLLLWMWAPVGAAQTQSQTMYKCADAQGRITYSSDACEKLGLKDTGPMVDRVTSMPFAPPPKPGASAPKDTERGGTQVKPVVPLLDKILK